MFRFAVYGRRPSALVTGLRLQHRVAGVGLYHSEMPGRLRRSPLPLSRDAEKMAMASFSQVLLPDLRSLRSFSSLSPGKEDGRLVYTSNLGKSVLIIKLFSYSTSLLTIMTVPYVMMKTGLGVDSLVLQAALIGMVGFFTFASPVMLHLLTKGYVVRLYYNSDRDLFTAITYNALLVQKKNVFSPADVEVPGVSKMFTTFYAKKKSMLLNPDLFPDPQDYHHLMGYDKPFTFNPEDLHKPAKDE